MKNRNNSHDSLDNAQVHSININDQHEDLQSLAYMSRFQLATSSNAELHANDNLVLSSQILQLIRTKK